MSQINLLPDYYIKQQFRKRVDLVFVIIFALMIFSMIAADRYSMMDFEAISQENTKVQGKFEEAARTTDDVMKKSMEKIQLLSTAKESTSLLQLIPRSYLLSAITNSCPKTVALNSVIIADKVIDPQAGAIKRVVTVTATTPPPPKKKITYIDIQGTCAVDGDASQYASNLKENPVFRNVTLKYTQEYKPTKKAQRGSSNKDAEADLFKPTREFYINMKVNREADIPEIIEQAKAKTQATSKPESKGKDAEAPKEAGE